MKISKKLLQINLSTLLLLMVITGLVIHGLSARAIIDKQKKKIDSYEEHLPEYNLAVKLEELKAEFAKSKSLYGDSNPIVRKLDIEIGALERQRKMMKTLREGKSAMKKKGWKIP